MLTTPTLAVALHDVEPATFERCALVREWLDDHGVDRVTLLVIPAVGGHAFSDRSPRLHAWLLERRDDGDAIAQHGLMHCRLRPAGPHRRWQGGVAAEFPGLSAAETRQRVSDGRRLLEQAGLRPRGFVAPAYAYTHALRHELRATYDWFATVVCCWQAGTGARVAPAFGLGTSSRVKRALSPALLRAGAPLARATLRLDLHPADFDHASHVLALEGALRRARRRRAVSYDELLAD
jgi:predicted deacetylase